MRAETQSACQARWLSRRRFVGYGAAGSLMAGIGQAQTIAPVPPGSPADETARIAAGSDRSEHLTIPVTINGHGPFHFVIDTGADRTVIANDIATQLGLMRGADITVQGVVQSIDSRVVAVNDLSFGGITRRKLSLPVLPRKYMGADGYLGLDVVDGARVTLDFRNRMLDISASRHTNAFLLRRPTEAFVPVRGSMGHLRSLNCRVDGVGTTCFLDTGAEISAGNSQLFNALVDRNPAYRVVGSLPITGITGGIINARVINVGFIRLHSVTFSDAAIAIADMQIFDVWGLAKTPALLIGMNFLRQFGKVSIDYGMKEIRFNLAAMHLARTG